MTKMIDFQTDPSKYRHWKITYDGPVAHLFMDVDEKGGLFDGYELKLNSYDLGVDIELADVVQRMRFEHPEVKVVMLQSAKDKVFCAGANIRMLGGATHSHKVNFCKFTNETRNTYEAALADSGQNYICAVKGACAGGGYELALACNYIMLTDDSASSVALPEVPLLAVLPGTGGLTRVTDKRKVRRDLADVFCSIEEGVKGKRAVEWRLVDEVFANSKFDEAVAERAREMAAASDKADVEEGIALTPINRTFDEDGVTYSTVEVALNRAEARATVTIKGPTDAAPADIQVLHYWKRVLKRVDMTSRSLVAIVEHGSCFAGPLAELLWAVDRSYMMLEEFDGDNRPLAAVTLSDGNFGTYPMGNDLTRLQTRFLGTPEKIDDLKGVIGEPQEADAAEKLGLITYAYDDIDWEDEVRLFMEERASFSPDAMTGMEANLRFAGPETMETRIFGRLTAWQNWIFQRPNAVGSEGALQRYGTGQRGVYDKERV